MENQSYTSCYHYAHKKGLTIVISALLALIVDQMADLNDNNVPAAMICSSCDDRQNIKQEIMQNKFWYI